MTHKKWIRLAIGLCIAAYFSWMFLRQTRLREIWSTFSEVDFVWLVAALSALSVGYSCRIQRWREMIARDNPRVTWRVCAGPFLGSFAVNNILPFRTGDILRSIAFNESLGASTGVVLATLFVERLLDLLMLLLFLLVMLAMFGLSSGSIAGIAGSVSIASVAVIVTLLVFPSILEPLLRLSESLALRISPSFGRRIVDEIQKSLATLEHLASSGRMLRLIIWSLLAWTAEGCVFWLTARSLPMVKIPAAAWLAFPIGSLAVLVPGAPGEVGTFHYFVGRTMTEIGNNAASGVAYALLVHAILWMATTFVGGPYLYFALKRESALRRLNLQALEPRTATDAP